MKHALIAIASIVMFIVLAVGASVALAPAEPVYAQAEIVNCEVQGLNPVRVVCTAAGVVVLNTTLDVPTVTLPPVTVTAPGATVTLPAPPRATETVRVPGPTVQIPVPGPTQTVTVNVPGEGTTATVTLPPKPGATKTVTIRPDGTPVPTATQTVTVTEQATPESTVSPSGQDEPDRGTLDEDTGFFSPDVDLGDDEFTLGETGLGLLSLLALAAVGLFAVYGGYRLGRKSAVDEDTEFLRALLDSVKINR